MAVYTEQIQKLYVAYFNRPADYEGLAFWEQVLTSNGGNVDAVSAFFAQSPEYKDQNAGKSYYQIVNQIYLNLFNREADVPGLEHWSGLLRNGTFTVDQIVKIIADNASNTDAQDKTTYLNKVAAATAFTAELNTASEIIGYTGAKANEAAKVWLSTVLGTQASLDAAIAPAALANTVNTIAQTGLSQDGQNYALTKGLDNITGTAGNDTIVGSIDGDGMLSELDTLSSVDFINGGTGTDTFRIAHASGDMTLGNVSNVEIIEISSAAEDGLEVNTSAVTGVTNLNVTKAAGVVDATAANSTDVNVSVKDNDDIGSITVNGGKNVNVVLADAQSDIDVGATGVDAAGNVTITATGAAVVNNSANATTATIEMGTISVGGGKTITVTQKAAANTAATVADGFKEAVVQGDVVVTAGATTTDITLKQDATVSALSRAAVTGVTEVTNVKFTSLEAGDTVTVGGLTFEAVKDLTAAQVAQAFANLAANARTLELATGDTQGSSASANGFFTGSLLADWSTGAATDDTVVFTGKANTAMGNLEATNATVTPVTDGVKSVSAQNRLGVTAGTVTIEGAAALKNVTVDGFSESTGDAGINGDSNAALTNVSLANGESFDIDSAASTLALTLNNVSGTVNVAAGTKTLNAAVTGDFVLTTLQSATAETINVSGTGNVAGSTADGASEAVTTINTTGMTAGSASFTIADGTTTTYVGGAAADYVNVSNADTAMTKAIDLGAGDDWLALEGVVTAPTATLKGGEGSDIIAINSESAVALSANGSFAGKIEGFEKLEITDNVTEAHTVNMANMDGITYVISHNSGAIGTDAIGEQQSFVLTKPTTARAEQQAVEVTGGATTNGNIVFNAGANVNIAVTAGMTADEVGAAIAAAESAIIAENPTVADVSYNAETGLTVTFTAAAGNVGSLFTVTPGTTGVTAGTVTETREFANSGIITVAGAAINVTAGLSIDQLGATIAAQEATIIENDPTVESVTYDSGTNTVVITYLATEGGRDQATLVGSDFGLNNGTFTETRAAAEAGDGVPSQTLDKMANNSTLELVEGGAGVIVKMADATGTADSFNIVTTVYNGSSTRTNTDFGVVDVAGVETLKLTAGDATPTDASGNATIDTAILALKADKATSLTIDGNSNLTLFVADSAALATVNASALTGKLALAAHGEVAMTITGGSAADTLYASTGVDGKADVINGGAGNDTIFVGSNGAKLTGGAGNDLFVVSAGSIEHGTKETNTYSHILDFQAGDLVQLKAFNVNETETVADDIVDVSKLSKLAATLEESTAQFSNFVDAAIKEAGDGEAVWFNYKGDAYVVIDSGESTDTFVNGEDMVVKLTGINGDNLSWNADYATLALI
ncbi:MAG: DUF4214 domain-containing protein [Pseudomonadota bacterium]